MQETVHVCQSKFLIFFKKNQNEFEQVAFQSNANHPLAESMGYIKFEGM